MTALYSARNLPVTWRPVLPCLAALSVARTYRVPAFLSATTSDTNNRLQLSQAREMARGVVREIRNSLGTPADSIADGESKVSWRALPAVLTVKGYADGRITRSARGPNADTSASALLLKAFDNASRRGATTMPSRNETATRASGGDVLARGPRYRFYGQVAASRSRPASPYCLHYSRAGSLLRPPRHDCPTSISALQREEPGRRKCLSAVRRRHERQRRCVQRARRATNGYWNGSPSLRGGISGVSRCDPQLDRDEQVLAGDDRQLSD